MTASRKKVSRQVALEEGLKFYFNGNPCVNGHVDFRLVSNYCCYTCSKARYRAASKRPEFKAVKKRYSRTDYLKNKGRYYLNNAKRRAVCLQATPSWLSQEDLDKMKAMFANRPKGYHVDHIVPLNSPVVCGLNVPWNLQYLLAYDNLVKGNK